MKRIWPYTAAGNFRNQNTAGLEDSFPIKRMDVPMRASSYNPKWIVKSGCHFSCMRYSLGIQIVTSSIDRSTNIQLCESQTVVRMIITLNDRENFDTET